MADPPDREFSQELDLRVSSDLVSPRKSVARTLDLLAQRHADAPFGQIAHYQPKPDEPEDPPLDYDFCFLDDNRRLVVNPRDSEESPWIWDLEADEHYSLPIGLIGGAICFVPATGQAVAIYGDSDFLDRVYFFDSPSYMQRWNLNDGALEVQVDLGSLENACCHIVDSLFDSPKACAVDGTGEIAGLPVSRPDAIEPVHTIAIMSLGENFVPFTLGPSTPDFEYDMSDIVLSNDGSFLLTVSQSRSYETHSFGTGIFSKYRYVCKHRIEMWDIEERAVAARFESTGFPDGMFGAPFGREQFVMLDGDGITRYDPKTQSREVLVGHDVTAANRRSEKPDSDGNLSIGWIEKLAVSESTDEIFFMDRSREGFRMYTLMEGENPRMRAGVGADRPFSIGVSPNGRMVALSYEDGSIAVHQRRNFEAVR